MAADDIIKNYKIFTFFTFSKKKLVFAQKLARVFIELPCNLGTEIIPTKVILLK